MINVSRWLRASVAIGALSLATGPVGATIYTLTVNGTISTDPAFSYDTTDRTGLFTTAGQSLAGKAFTVVYKIDSSEPWQVAPPSVGSITTVYTSGINFYYSLGEAIVASVKVGGVTFRNIGTGGQTADRFGADTQSQLALSESVPDTIQINTGLSGIDYTRGNTTFSGLNIRVNNGFSNAGHLDTNLLTGGTLDAFDFAPDGANGQVSFAANGNATTYAYFRTSSTKLEIAAVPETSTWAMLVGGFGVIGGTLRRRKMVVSFT
jgi:hypothetical protein